MKIYVPGSGPLIKELIADLEKAGLPVVTVPPILPITICYTVILHKGETLSVDSVDCDFDRNIRACIGELTTADIVVRHSGGEIFSDSMIKITTPLENQEAVILGIRRGLALSMKPKPQPVLPQMQLSLPPGLMQSEPRLLSSRTAVVVIGILLLLLGFSLRAHAQQQTDVRRVGGTIQSSADVIDPANSAVKVRCILGCAASAPSNQTATGTLSALDATVVMTAAGVGTSAVQITGTWVGTINFEASVDTTNFFSINGLVPTTAVTVTSTTTNGSWVIPTAGYDRIRFRMNPFTSGTATITVEGSAGTQATINSSSTVTANQGSPPWTQRIQDGAGATLATVTGANALKVDGSAVTQPISGTVTANAGTNLNTSALALDATIGRTQGSATAGQTGPLVQGAVTTAAPTYTTAQTNPLSLTTAGALRTDSSAVTQPVSGTVTANQGGTWNLNNITGTVSLPTGAATETTLTKLPLAQASTTSGQSGPLVQGAVTTAAPTYTTAQTNPLSLTTAGALRTDASGTTQPVSGTVTSNQGGAPWTQRIQDGAGATLATVTAGNALKVDNSAVTQPVSGTVTANAGTGNFTVVQPTNSNLKADVTSNAANIATETTVAKLTQTQASTTTGQSGPLIQGAVTTSAPAYTTAQTSPISLTTAGALRTDASATTQPISGTVTANQGGTWTVQPGNTANTTPWLSTINQGGNSATVTASNALKVDGSAVTQPISGTVTANAGTGNFNVIGTASDNSANSTAKLPVVAARANAAAPTWTEGNQAPLSVDLAGSQRVAVTNTPTVTANAGTGTFTVAGAKTNNAAVPGATNIGALTAVSTASAPAYTEGNLVALSVDNSGSLRTTASAAAVNDVTATGDLVATGSVTTATLNGSTATGVFIFGTWVATVQFEASIDGTTYFSVNALPVTGGALVTATTVNGQWTIESGGFANVRARVSAFTSGTVSIRIRSSTGPSVFSLGNQLPSGTNTIGIVQATQPTAANLQATVSGSVAVTQATSSNLNADVNEKLLNGTAFLTGNGVTGTGSQRVTIASDNTSFSVGTKTNNNAAPGATNVGTLPALATAAVQTWTEGNQVALSVDLSGAARTKGILADNGVAAGTNRQATLPSIYQTSYLNGTAATQGRNGALSQGTDGLLWVAALPSVRPASYSAATTTTAAASPTDLAGLPGNASNTVLVTKVICTCTQTTAGTITMNLLKRSTADTAGTSSNTTVVPDDSNYAAAVSVPLTYTANPTTGTLVGNIEVTKFGAMATGTATPNDIYIGNFTQKPIVLRGTAQVLYINFGGTAIAGLACSTTFHWIETATILP